MNQVKDELEALEKQRSKSEKTRLSVNRELRDAGNSAKKLQEVSLNCFQWLKCHRTHGKRRSPRPTSSFWLKAFPRLEFSKDAEER